MNEQDPPAGTKSDRDALRHWQQADAIFDTLLDSLPAARAVQLASMDLPPEVRSMVEKLLASDSHPGPLDDPSRLLTALELDVPEVEMRGRRLGDWTLGAELGRGGMSVVYQAERSIGDSRQTAALKLLTVGALAGSGRERFLREQGILARLEHPNIAGLLDAGVLDDGTPWMAMARVDGMHIDDWCRLQKLGVPATVRLFVKVCDTLAYAHRSLVIHRDIKPSNVLVDGDGHVHLLDFGIAGLIEDEAEHATRTMAITPRYAAPEQFAGANPSTAMDVYGLGALLYCLLTGKPPASSHLSDGQTPVPLASRSCASEEPFTDRARQLRGDLDALLAMALARDPKERYAAPAELAADLRHWLDGRPLAARKQGRRYRLRKFIGRHRLGMAASLLVVAAIVAGVSISLWQARVARANAERATAVKDFMVRIFEASTPDMAAGEDPPASELLRRGSARVRTKFAAEPALLAQMLGVIGTTQQERGLMDDAESSLDDALAAYRTLRRPTTDYARTLKARANLYYDRGDMDKALAGFAQADQIAASSGLSPLDRLRAQIAILSANAQVEAGRPEKAEANLRKLLGGMQQAGMANSYNHVHASNILGAALMAQERDDEAASLLREALLAHAALNSNPTLKCDILNDLSIALFQGHKLEQSIATSRKAIACSRRYYGETHQAVLAGLGNLAWALSVAGHPGQAAEQYDQLLPLIRLSVGDRPSNDIVYTLTMAALARDEAGRADTMDAIRQAYREMQQLNASQQKNLSWVPPVYGLLLFERGEEGARLHLGPFKPSCIKLDAISRTSQRICLAQLLLARDQDQCPQTSFAEPPTELTADAQGPWLAGYWLVQQRCNDVPAARDRATAQLRKTLARLPTRPQWLAQRLTTGL